MSAGILESTSHKEAGQLEGMVGVWSACTVKSVLVGMPEIAGGPDPEVPCTALSGFCFESKYTSISARFKWTPWEWNGRTK